MTDLHFRANTFNNTGTFMTQYSGEDTFWIVTYSITMASILVRLEQTDRQTDSIKSEYTNHLK
jgi:hypothetical protein